MIETARQRRAQQVEAKYAADLRRLRQAKEAAARNKPYAEKTANRDKVLVYARA